MISCAEFVIRWTNLLLCGILCLLSARLIVSCVTVLQILVPLFEYECISVTYLYYKTHIDVPVTTDVLVSNSTTTQHWFFQKQLHLDENWINPLAPKLNPSAQGCLTRFFTADFASWTVHFVNICVKNQQMQQLLIQFINYVW
jgi:hypothetical protein